MVCPVTALITVWWALFFARLLTIENILLRLLTKKEEGDIVLSRVKYTHQMLTIFLQERRKIKNN